MEPELEKDDVILSKVLSRDDYDKIKVGDVVTYVAEYGAQKGLTITHKVVEGPVYNEELGKTVIRTMGVKPGAPVDPPVPVENVKAVMVTKVGFISGIYDFITSTAGLILVIVLPLGSMIAIMTYRLVYLIRKKPVKTYTKKEVEEIRAAAVKEYIKKRNKEIAEKAVKEYIERETGKGKGKED
jgi:hypothetical protein